tara:strand:+ start:2897 stop:3202 length:306 start_codon:yes stop_codon:yes gene_type:complete
MAALTFVPTALSAKASLRGAAVARRSSAKVSKRACFTVKASDDDMDFMVRTSQSFFRDDGDDGARGDASYPLSRALSRARVFVPSLSGTARRSNQQTSRDC